MNKTVILGGGFAGVEAAIQLRKKKQEVLLISNRPYLFIYPISIWIPVKKKKFEDVKLDLQQLAKIHGFELLIDSVETIDTENKAIITSKNKVDYDYLILAMGMNKVMMEGMENTLSICGNPEEAQTIADRLEELRQKGKGKIAIGFGGNPKDTKGSAVRGGPAFEMLFNFRTYFRKLGLSDQFEINFFAPMKEPGKKMGEKAFGKMQSFYKRYDIATYIGKKIKGFEEKAVIFEDDSKLESDLTIYISGGKGHQVLHSSGLPLSDAGFVKIDSHCQVEGHPEIYAIGDIAEIEGPKWAAKQGHVAEVMAGVSASNIWAQINNETTRKTYTDHLNIICVMDSGDGAAFLKRTTKGETMIPLPIVGHWMKQGWGFYYKNTKLKRMPRIPGM